MIKPGRYRHFKGREYEVIGVAKHSETLEEMVVYRQLYGEHGLWVRPASMWEETVERDGKTSKSFTYFGDEEYKKRLLKRRFFKRYFTVWGQKPAGIFCERHIQPPQRSLTHRPAII